MDEFVAIKKKASPTSTAASVAEPKEKTKAEVKEKAESKANPEAGEKAELKAEAQAKHNAQETQAHKRKAGRSYCSLSALRGQLIISKKGLTFDEAGTKFSLRITRVDEILAATITEKMLLCTEALFYLDEKSLGAAGLIGMDTGDYRHVGKYDAMRHIPLPEAGEMHIAGRVLSLAEDRFRIRIGNNWKVGKSKKVPRIKVSSAPPEGWKKGLWIEETLIRSRGEWHIKT